MANLCQLSFQKKFRAHPERYSPPPGSFSSTAGKQKRPVPCVRREELTAALTVRWSALPELLDSAGCADVEITWGSEPVEPVEAIMRSAGLRDADSGDDAAWDVAGFEKSLLENYGVTPHHYEDLGDGVYQVYVEINGEIVPFVTVDSATGDYHG
mgnify:FL=1